MIDDGKRLSRRRRAVVGLGALTAIVAAVAVSSGWLRHGETLGPSSSPDRIAAAFDRDMAKAPALAPWREEMQRDFPALYDQMRQTFVGHIKAGEDKAEAMEAALLTAGAYRRLHQGAVLRASEATLEALTAENRKAMALFRSSTDEVCARYVMTGATSNGSPDQLLAVARRGALTLRAIHEGETAPVDRPPLSAEEAGRFRAALLAKGLGPDLARRVFEGGLDQLSAADQCKVGRGIGEALAAVPAPLAAKVTAALTATMS